MVISVAPSYSFVHSTFNLNFILEIWDLLYCFSISSILRLTTYFAHFLPSKLQMKTLTNHADFILYWFYFDFDFSLIFMAMSRWLAVVVLSSFIEQRGFVAPPSAVKVRSLLPIQSVPTIFWFTAILFFHLCYQSYMHIMVIYVAPSYSFVGLSNIMQVFF